MGKWSLMATGATAERISTSHLAFIILNIQYDLRKSALLLLAKATAVLVKSS
jgi:hypothetical protein